MFTAPFLAPPALIEALRVLLKDSIFTRVLELRAGKMA